MIAVYLPTRSSIPNHKPIVCRGAGGHEEYLSSVEALDLADQLWDAAAKHKSPPAIREQAHPIAKVMENPGVEYLVFRLPTNGHAFRQRMKLQKDGLKSRTKKLRAGCFAVYATKPTEDSK